MEVGKLGFSLINIFLQAAFICITLGACLSTQTLAAENFMPPRLTNTPRLDVLVTNPRPLLSVFNAHGGHGLVSYTFQLDTDPKFGSPNLLTYSDVAETPYVTSKQVEAGHELKDKTLYYWRAKARDQKGNQTLWGEEAGGVTARFYTDFTSDDHPSTLLRTPIAKVSASSGSEPGKLIDIGDQADQTYWEGALGETQHDIVLDLGQKQEVARIWQLSESTILAGRPQEYIWQYSQDAQLWHDLAQTQTTDADGFRRIIDLIHPISARYWRLVITSWHGPAPRLYELTFYSPLDPEEPIVAPEGDYLLLVGNRHDGSGYENLISLLQETYPELALLTLPYWSVSPEVVQQLSHPPLAIILSGLGRCYESLPMFEFNGEFALIREAELPMLGICGGHQLMAMAQGYTFVRQMGRGFYTKTLDDILFQGVAPIKIIQKDRLFRGLPNPFYAVQLHSWEVVIPPLGYQVLAISEPGIIEVMKDPSRLVYGVQFHGEINAPFNTARLALLNFLLQVEEH